MKKRQIQQQGIAIVTVLSLLVVLVSVVAISSLLALSNRRSSADSIMTTRAQYAAESGIEQALYQIFYVTKQNWDASADKTFKVNNKDPNFDTCAFKKFLTGKWQNADPDRIATKNNNASCQYYTNAAVTTPAIANLYNNQVPVTLTGTVGGADFNVQVTRTDNNTTNSISLKITSLGTVKDGTTEKAARQLNRTVEISTAPYDGDRFAVLTKAVNCSLCHLHVDNMTRAYAAPGSTAAFERVRMAVLEENVNLNPDHDGDTFIGGTLYVRRNVSGTQANEVYSPKWLVGSPGKVAAGPVASILGKPFGQPDAASAAADAVLINTPTNKTVANAKIYQLYPTSDKVGPGKDYTDWPDGSVPDAFPTIVPDANGDDFISDSEWANYINGAPVGRLTVPAASSATIFGVRRPSSATTVVEAVSYDPTVVNTTLSATTPQGLGAAAFAAGGALSGLITTLTADLRTGTAANATTTAIALVNGYRGWLVQEALASPNNRDYQPGSDNTTLASTSAFSLSPNADGSTKNNFWVRYVPADQMLQLQFRYNTDTATLHTCIPTPATNSTLVLAGSNCAVLNIPLSSSDIFPSASNSAVTALSTGSVWDGNLIINAGTLSSSNTAVNIDGTVNINGDVVIRGQITGRGRIVARGNIYIVGDFVYGCGATACQIDAGAGNPSYRSPEGLPLIGLLAGGVISAGDYDYPDYRASNGNTAGGSNSFSYGGGAFDLVNDQVGRHVNGTNLPAPLPYYNIPGSTGTNSSRGNCSGDMGFVPMTSAIANDRARQAVDSFGAPAQNRRYFKAMPFGLMVARSGFCSYENGGTQLNNGNTATVVSLFPSNGPIRTGSGSTAGFYAQPNSLTATQLAANLTCATGTGLTFRMNNTRFPGQNNQQFNTNFWCTPNAGSFHRTWSNSSNNSPALDASSWVAQSTQNAAADNSVGMSTGWLGGLTDLRTVGGNTYFTRLGDLSQSRLLKLMWLSSTENGRAIGPLRTDGIFYSTHGIFTLARSYQNTWQNARSTNEGRWTHNGSVIAAELGFLVTADYTGGVNARFTVNNTKLVDFSPSPTIPNNTGPAMGIFFDERSVGFLQVQSGNAVVLRRIGSFTQANR